jgi:hypothetical protein
MADHGREFDEDLGDLDKDIAFFVAKCRALVAESGDILTDLQTQSLEKGIISNLGIVLKHGGVVLSGWT